MTRRLGWRCRICDAEGYDGPGLPTFWAHYRAFHLSIWRGAR